MTNFVAPPGAADTNELKQSMAALTGLATGVLSDGELSDVEIGFLNTWLSEHDAIAHEWPGNIIHGRIKAALADGIISTLEREDLIHTLQLLISGDFERLTDDTHATELGFDRGAVITFSNSRFCFTGDFVFGPRSVCTLLTQRKGGVISKSISEKLDYLIIGSLGSKEWKHGSYGTKIEKAMNYKSQGLRIKVVSEDIWAHQL